MNLPLRWTGRRNGASRQAFPARSLRRARMPERAERPDLPGHGADALPWGRHGGRRPLGDTPNEAISRPQPDKLLVVGDPEATGLVHGVVEEFARSLADVAGRLLREEARRGTERIAVDGGMRASRVGGQAVGRESMLLKTGGRDVDLVPIRHARARRG